MNENLYKICWNCKAVMQWDDKYKRFECKLCGNCEEVLPRSEIPKYIK